MRILLTHSTAGMGQGTEFSQYMGVTA